jgi:hypothetical protein
MDINKFTSDLTNMDQVSRDKMLMELAQGLLRAGVLPAAADSSLGGASEVMAYLTRQPVPLRGLRLLGVHAVECVQIMHPTKKILLEIPKADYDEEKHGPIHKQRKAAAAVITAPPADEDEDEDDEAEETDSTDDDDSDDEAAGEDTGEEESEDKPLKTRSRRGKRGRK